MEHFRKTEEGGEVPEQELDSIKKSPSDFGIQAYPLNFIPDGVPGERTPLDVPRDINSQIRKL